MADTQRTAAQIIALLVNNTTGDISPQDLRDFAESMRTPHGKQYWHDSAVETAISSAGAFVKANGTSIGTLSDPYKVDTTTTPNKLIYTGVSERHFQIMGVTSMTVVSGGNQDLAAVLYYNGAPMLDTETHTTSKTAGDLVTLTCHGDIVMSTNDYIELWVTNDSSTSNVIVKDFYLFMAGMFQ